MGYALSDKDKEHPDNEVLQGDADFKVRGFIVGCICSAPTCGGVWYRRLVTAVVVVSVLLNAEYRGSGKRNIRSVDARENSRASSTTIKSVAILRAHVRGSACVC